MTRVQYGRDAAPPLPHNGNNHPSPYAYTPYPGSLPGLSHGNSDSVGARLGEVSYPTRHRDPTAPVCFLCVARCLAWHLTRKQAVWNFTLPIPSGTPETLVSRFHNPRVIIVITTFDIVILNLSTSSVTTDLFLVRHTRVRSSDVTIARSCSGAYCAIIKDACGQPLPVRSTDANQTPRNNDKYNRVCRRVASG